METLVIITLCALLLFAYVFDISATKTKIPSVILLLFLGYGVKRGTDALDVDIPDLTVLLPALGSIGLILIVLEGAMELELDKSKLRVLGQSSLMALIPIFVLVFGLALALSYFAGLPLKSAVVNAIPLSVISSSIAIPTVAGQNAANREFIIYESSLSDIFGVLLFNFIVLNETIGLQSVGYFFLDVLLTLVVTGIATLALAFLLSKISHHVKFVPIIISIILIYEVAKLFHLPGLIFILLFGIFLGNLDELRRFSFIRKLRPEILENEMHRFKELTGEIAFLVRGTFFLLFGFLINTDDLLNPDSAIWALAIVAAIFMIRYAFLKILKKPASPLLWIAPRGLITILLFLGIPLSDGNPIVNNSLVIQVIIFTAMTMMLGLMTHKTEDS